MWNLPLTRPSFNPRSEGSGLIGKDLLLSRIADFSVVSSIKFRPGLEHSIIIAVLLERINGTPGAGCAFFTSCIMSDVVQGSPRSFSNRCAPCTDRSRHHSAVGVAQEPTRVVGVWVWVHTNTRTVWVLVCVGVGWCGKTHAQFPSLVVL